MNTREVPPPHSSCLLSEGEGLDRNLSVTSALHAHHTARKSSLKWKSVQQPNTNREGRVREHEEEGKEERASRTDRQRGETDILRKVRSTTPVLSDNSASAAVLPPV